MNTHCLIKWTNSNPSVHNAGTRDSICLPVITKVLRLQVFNMQHVATVAGCHQVAVRGLDGERVAEPQHLIKGSAEQIADVRRRALFGFPFISCICCWAPAMQALCSCVASFHLYLNIPPIHPASLASAFQFKSPQICRQEEGCVVNVGNPHLHVMLESLS